VANGVDGLLVVRFQDFLESLYVAVVLFFNHQRLPPATNGLPPGRRRLP
jgi:hypothetical protein